MSFGLLLVCSVLIVVLPMTTFFSVKDGALDPVLRWMFPYDITDAIRLNTAAIAAVLAVNLVLVTFAILAWLEDPDASAAKQKLRKAKETKAKSKKDD